MNKRKVLLVNPISLTTLCDTAKRVLLLVIALATEDEVPYIVVRTVSSVRALEVYGRQGVPHISSTSAP